MATSAALTAPASPCIQVCTLDAGGCCTGCFRTGAEIAAWTSLNAAEQWAVVTAAATRRARYRAALTVSARGSHHE